VSFGREVVERDGVRRPVEEGHGSLGAIRVKDDRPVENLAMMSSR
jgi:hypothetical protein